MASAGCYSQYAVTSADRLSRRSVRCVSRSRWTISLPGEFGEERCLPFLEGGELYPELLQLAVGLRQFGPRLPLSQVTVTIPGPDQVLDLAAQQPQPRVAVHRG